MVVLLILLLWQYLLIAAIRKNIVTVATHAIGKNLTLNKILVTHTLVLTNT